jgi:hypothetical protein
MSIEESVLLESDMYNPVWCHLKSDEIMVILNSNSKTEIRNAVLRTQRERNIAFNTLMEFDVKNQMINLDYINNFGSYFGVNIPCLCDNMVDTLLNTEEENVSKVEKSKIYFYIGRIFGQGKTGVASSLCVKDKGCPYILKGMKGVSFRSYNSMKILELKGGLSRDNYNAWKFTDNSYNILSSGSSGFKNQTTIHMALNNILGDNPNYLYQYDAFYCGNQNKDEIDKINYFNTGYNITELSEYGDMSNYINNIMEEINDDILVDMLRQILRPLFILKQDMYMFNHSDLKTRNVFVSRVGGSPVYKLADFDKSSIFWNGIRFYNNVYDLSVLEYLSRFGSKILDISFVTEKDGKIKFNNLKYTGNEETDLTIGNYRIQTYSMHNPYPIFNSYDIYTLFYSLMLEPKIYKWVVDNQKDSVFFEVFRKLWEPCEFPIVMKSLDESYRKDSIDEKVALSYIKKKLLLHEFWMKKDVSFLINDLKISLPSSSSKQKPAILLKKSKNCNLCISECKSSGMLKPKSCYTNKKETLVTTHNWDWC